MLDLKRAVTSAKNFEPNFCPLSVSRYVGIPYGLTKWSTNRVAALVDVPLVTGVAFVSSFYWSGKTITS